MLAIFSLTLFVSALLLFLVQPMFGKMVLPLLGGSPAVWNTCMVFYQAALLAGYAYAHAAPRWLGLRRQAGLHLGLLALVVLTLPIGIAQGWTPPTDSSPIPWLLLVLLASVGFPFFVISATAPLLQKWFTHTGHAAAKDPYFLYGASNLGSMVALLSYPFLVETYLRLADQTRVWAVGYLILVGLIATCAVMLWRAPAAAVAATALANPGAAVLEDDAVTWGSRIWWVLLAFAPSSLLLGVTTYMSTDIAAVPLLWVIPLALYLLTFVLVFAAKPLLPQRLMVWTEPFLVVPLAVLFFLNLKGAWPLFPLHLLTFFVIAMVCHGELMRYRPAAAHLTEFYLWMSVGGVLGGLFNALVAPVAFNALIEYPLIIAGACLLRPYLPASSRAYGRLLDFLLPLVLVLLLGGLTRVLLQIEFRWLLLGIFSLSCLAGLFCFSFSHRPLRFGLGVGALMLANVLVPAGQSRVMHQERNFFGVLQIRYDQEGQYHLLTHGTTLHGAQSLDPARRREPLTYFYPTGPLGQMFAAFAGKDAHWRLGIIGLGTGSIACYGKAGQQLTFYEIDPAVERIARDPRYFTFLQDCPAPVEVVLGDARVSLQKAPDRAFDVLILDAFSSDSIPLHLVTREALSLYRAKLRAGGILAFHISNRYLDLRPVLGNLARDAGLTCLVQEDTKLSDAEKKARKTASMWAVMGRPESLPELAANPRWQPAPSPGKPLWTDDFSNILEVFKWSAVKFEAPTLIPDSRGASPPGPSASRPEPDHG